jgi:hypothetical protein
VKHGDVLQRQDGATPTAPGRLPADLGQHDLGPHSRVTQEARQADLAGRVATQPPRLRRSRAVTDEA